MSELFHRSLRRRAQESWTKSNTGLMCACVSVQAREAVEVAVGVLCEEELGGGGQLRCRSGGRDKGQSVKSLFDYAAPRSLGWG